jgi:hypothetical protein
MWGYKRVAVDDPQPVSPVFIAGATWYLSNGAGLGKSCPWIVPAPSRFSSSSRLCPGLDWLATGRAALRTHRARTDAGSHASHGSDRFTDTFTR